MPLEKHNPTKYFDYHQSIGHIVEECISLKKIAEK